MAELIYTISDTKIIEFKEGFLKCCPVPVDVETGLPEMTENEWIKEWGKTQFLNMYKRGKRQIACEEVLIDNNIVE